MENIDENEVIGPNIEEECRAQGKVKTLPSNKCRKKGRNPDS